MIVRRTTRFVGQLTVAAAVLFFLLCFWLYYEAEWKALEIRRRDYQGRLNDAFCRNGYGTRSVTAIQFCKDAEVELARSVWASALRNAVVRTVTQETGYSVITTNLGVWALWRIALAVMAALSLAMLIALARWVAGTVSIHNKCL